MIAGLVALAIIATLFVPLQNLRFVAQPLLVIDSLTLVALIAVALCADRYWPLYVAAMELLTVALHGVRAYDSTILPYVYARLEGELSYPLFLLLVIGTRRHVRRGAETSWSWQMRRERAGHPVAGGDQR